MFIFIDESGDLGQFKGTQHFIIGMLFYYYKKELSQINRLLKFHNNYLWKNGKLLKIKLKTQRARAMKFYPINLITALSFSGLPGGMYLREGGKHESAD